MLVLQHNWCTLQLGPGSMGLSRSPAPESDGGVRGNPTAPVLSLQNIKRLAIRLHKELLLFVISFLSPQAVLSIALFFSWLWVQDFAACIKVNANWDIVVIVGKCSGIFWISARETSAVTTCCYCFCAAVSLGGAAYFCNNIDNVL